MFSTRKCSILNAAYVTRVLLFAFGWVAKHYTFALAICSGHVGCFPRVSALVLFGYWRWVLGKLIISLMLGAAHEEENMMVIFGGGGGL